LKIIAHVGTASWTLEAITSTNPISDFWPLTSDLHRRLVRPNEIVSGAEKVFDLSHSNACQAAASCKAGHCLNASVIC
jgi:hypothetical protein